MKIYVDADACPKVVKEILFKAAKRTGVSLVLVANQPLGIPRQPEITTIQVEKGFDVADHKIVSLLLPGDLVITADIPLADHAIEKGALALNPRGQLYTSENIKARLSVRNFMEELRSVGEISGGPAAFSAKDKQAFANALDRILSNLYRL